jgi:hypothetical protein
MTVNEPVPTACANCGQPFGAPPPRFCPACGQESRISAPSVGEFLQQFGGAYFSTEGALWRTLKLLLMKPGELTVQYLAGRRKHYVLPLRLYLTISVFVLLGVRLIGTDNAMQIEVKDSPRPSELRNVTILGLGEEGQGIGMKDGVFYCNHVPAWVCKRVQRRISTKAEDWTGELQDFKERFIGNLGGAMFGLLPAFALWTQLAYLNRRWRYTEHLVLALHLHTFWFLMVPLFVSGLGWLSGPAVLAMPVYTWLALRRVFADAWWARLLRVGLVAMLYLLTLTLVLTVVALWTVVA